MISRLVAVAVVVAGCTPLPDTVGEAAPSRTVWRLSEVNEGPAGFPATLRLLSDGRVLGTGPCSPFEARQTAPLPWFEIEDVERRVRACPDATEEEAFLLLLGAMDFAEVAGENLLLSNSEGQSLYFRAAEGPNT